MSGLSRRALVQLSCAIGVATPLSLFARIYGSEFGQLTADDITKVVKAEFDCKPGAMPLGVEESANYPGRWTVLAEYLAR